MKRRTFIKDVTVGSLILQAGPRLWAQSVLPDLASIQGESPAQITKTAVEAIGGMGRFITKGDRVMIKPNIGWDRRPEQAACTNPEVVRALVEMCRDAGAKEVKVMDNPCNPAQRTYLRSGIAQAAKDAGAKVLYCSEHKMKKVDLKGEWLKDWEVYTDFIETDKIINVPIAKHHSLSRVTLGMKNWLGCLGGNRNQLHQNLDAAMIDLAAYFKPVLTVLDAYRVLLRNGPQGGRPSDMEVKKTVIAGTDYVAVDALGLSFFDIKPEDMPYLRMANERGFGEFNLEKLKIEKRTV
ncbi:MAG: DUF362 domain-containing protein [Acidobacteria bacterium]|nr:DUF362 domain-containing protein [Acidobacteriota bacterium]MBU4329521.1 DUF362 domain-containing protein [Acidobacteriota bacterium]MCG2816252.1 DUF362 domain-containing protein [Candidatus Aminicenantes bacterium]